MVKVVSGLRKTVFKGGLELGAIVAIVFVGAYYAKKYNVGTRTTSSLIGAGQALGSGLIAPFTGILSGVNSGGQGLVSQLGAIQKSVSDQLGVSTDQFNKLFHPDWYNQDGSYSPSNPNYGKGQSSLYNGESGKTVDTSKPGPLPPTSPSFNATGSIGTSSLGLVTKAAGISDLFNSFTNTITNANKQQNSSQVLNQMVGLTSQNTARFGTTGLSQSQVDKDVALSKKLGGPVFDTKGNIVAVNGVSFVR